MKLAFVLTPVAVAGAMNGIIYGLGWNRKNSQSLLPPGWVIGAIWTVLLALLGYATSLAFDGREFALVASFIALILVCISYPLYTRGLRPEYGKIGNVASLIVAFAVAIHAALRLPKTLTYLAPLLAWASYVNLVQK